MADKPTPMRRADPRLSNCVLEGGRQKPYGPPPPPPPDTDCFEDVSYGSGLAWGLSIVILVGALAVTAMWMVHLGCTPLGCH